MNATDWTAQGRAAFHAGRSRYPAADPAVAEAIEGLAVGAGAAGIMRAWGQGWDAANLAAPVPAETAQTRPGGPVHALRPTELRGYVVLNCTGRAVMYAMPAEHTAAVTCRACLKRSTPSTATQGG